MSDSEDEAAFASADEGDDKTQEQLKSKPTEDKQKEQPKPKEEKDKSQNQGKSKNVKAENPNPAKGKGKSQDQVKTQPQGKQGGKKGKGGKGKKVEKKEKSEEKTADEPVSEPAVAKSPVDTEETVQTETGGAVQTETDKQSKTEDKITQEKTGTESTESRLSGDLPTESNKKEEIKSGESGESKDIDDKPVVSKSEKDSPETTESKSTTDDKEAKKDPKSALDQLATDKESGDSWSWGNWGSSLIDVASSSVSTFTHQVGEGFNTIMDTVETSLGAPSPEELILLQGIKEKDEEVIKTAPEDTSMDRAEDIDKDEEEKKTEEETKETEKESEKSSTASGGGGSWFSGWGMSSLTSVVQNTTNIVQNKSKHLVSGGLDVLETIGKKTMDVIKDHDPGLTLTKSLFLTDKGDKQNLSMILREAKEEAAKKAEQEKEFEETRKAHFGCMFDEYQGLAHLEALEILSNQCEKKVQILLSSMPPEVLAGIKQELIQIKQVFEMEEDEEEEEEAEHEFSKLVTEYLSEFHLGTTPDKLNKTQEKIRKIITDFYVEKEDSTPEPKMVHQAAIQSLAELTSKSVEQFHKAGELVLLQKDSDKKFLDRSKSLSSFTKVLCTEVGILSTKFSHCLNKLAEDMEDNSSVNPLVTNVYLEAQNSSTYIQDAFQLLLPCLQQSLIESTANT